jgi:hypothetical protein
MLQCHCIAHPAKESTTGNRSKLGSRVKKNGAGVHYIQTETLPEDQMKAAFSWPSAMGLARKTVHDSSGIQLQNWMALALGERIVPKARR